MFCRAAVSAAKRRSTITESARTCYRADRRGHRAQLTKSSTISLTYLNSLGQHQLITRNANAPQVPGYDPTAPNIYRYYSEAVFKQNQLIANFNARFGQKLSLFGFYTLSYANSDSGGVSSNPSNSADLKLDYGRAAFDVRNQMFLIGTWAAPWNMRFSPFVVAASGKPFNITLGQDVNGDSSSTTAHPSRSPEIPIPFPPPTEPSTSIREQTILRFP